MPYEQLNMESRECLARKKEAGWTQRQIAAALGRSPASISRELKRNGGWERYSAVQAEARARSLRRKPRRACRLNRAELWRVVDAGLRAYWSPEQIVLEWGGLCTQTIYNHLRSRKLMSAYRVFLRRGARPYRPRGRLPKYQRIRNPRSIHQQPAIVATRTRPGDWEADTFFGAGGRSCLAVYVERRSRFVVLRRLHTRKARVFNRVTRALFASHPQWPLHTLSVDHGMEFSMFRQLERQLAVTVYFADPHSPWQKGSVENINGLLRQFFPKGMDLSNITQQHLDHVASLLNTRPRKVLNNRTPAQLMS